MIRQNLCYTFTFMTTLDGIVLGLVQGLTEFLPISSSGHLLLVRVWLGINTESGLAVDAVLQLATILAVGIYFWRDLWTLCITFLKILGRAPVDQYHKTLLWAVILGTIPAAALGYFLESYMDTVFRSAILVAGTLVVGAILMWLAERFATQNQTLTVGKGWWVGVFQTLALVPGISRSGATISGGLLLGLTREDAARFSFILSFPIIVGSGLKKLLELQQEHLLASLGFPLVMSFVLAFVVGLVCIHYLLKYLKAYTLHVFVYYRLALAAVILGILTF